MTPLLVDLASWWIQSGLLLGAGLVLPALVRLPGAGVLQSTPGSVEVGRGAAGVGTRT